MTTAIDAKKPLEITERLDFRDVLTSSQLYTVDELFIDEYAAGMTPFTEHARFQVLLSVFNEICFKFTFFIEMTNRRTHNCSFQKHGNRENRK
jgi:hypothetical protein